MESVFITVLADGRLKLFGATSPLSCGKEVPLLPGDDPDTKAQQLCQELGLQPLVLSAVGQLQLFQPRPKSKASRHRRVMTWKAAPTRRIRLYLAQLNVPSLTKQSRLILEDVPYGLLPPQTEHWLAWVLCNEGVEADIMCDASGRVHHTNIKRVPVIQLCGSPVAVVA